MREITKGHWRRLGHCGNASPITGECMLGCDPGWCKQTPEAQQAETKRHALEQEASDPPDGWMADGSWSPGG